MKRNKYKKILAPTHEIFMAALTKAAEVENEFDQILNDLFWQIKNDIKDLYSKNSTEAERNYLINKLHTSQMVRSNTLKVLWDYLLRDILISTYKNIYYQTYLLVNTYKDNKSVDSISVPTTKMTNNYIEKNYLNIPWCQDGKIYRDRTRRHLIDFNNKLDYILLEGIKNNWSEEQIDQKIKELCENAVYNAARLLRTETAAVWSQATKDAYLDSGIEYVEIIGDAACREVCTGYVGEIVRLDTAALGNQLPPYHPNCACEFIAYEYWKDITHFSPKEVK